MNTTETVMVWSVDADRQPPRLLSEVLDILADVESNIPIEYRASAEIDFDPLYEHGETYSQVRVTYTRPMTTAELEQYTAEETEHWANQLKIAEERVVYCREQIGQQP